jgi:hypothetical protein
MSISKSRWKGALLATVAASAFAPVVSRAQSLSLSLSLSPLGLTSAYGGPGAAGAPAGTFGQGPSTTEVIPPDQTIPIYVYATITGASAPSSNYIDGLNYVYFNVNETSGVNRSEGSIVAATPNAALGFTANGSQNGSIGATTGNLAVGSNSLLTGIAKPRSGRMVYSGSVSPDGTNVIVSGNTISFLVETLSYQPAVTDSSYTSGGGVVNSFAIAPESSISPLLGSNYPAANYAVGESSQPGYNTGAGAAYTFTNYNVSTGGVNLVDAVPGDAALTGSPQGSDFTTVVSNFTNNSPGWVNGEFFPNESGESGSDFTTVVGFFQDSGYAVPTAAIGGGTGGSSVPEPTSMGALAVGGLALVRRRNRK